MTHNGIIDDATGYLLKCGYTDFTSQVKSGQSIRTDVPEGAECLTYDGTEVAKWTGSVWTTEVPDTTGVDLSSPVVVGKSPDGTEWKAIFTDTGKVKIEKVTTIDPIIDYSNRNKDRSATLEKATISMVGYYMTLGDDEETANGKVGLISRMIKADLYPYILGDTQPLKDNLQAIDSLPHFDQAAKDFIIALL